MGRSQRRSKHARGDAESATGETTRKRDAGAADPGQATPETTLKSLAAPVADRAASHGRFRRGRRSLAAGLALAFVAVAVMLMPHFLSQRSIFHWILTRATSELPLELYVQQIQLGWFTHPRFERLEIRQADGQLFAQIAALELERTLWQLLTDRQQLGVVRINEAQLWVRVRDDGSNVEDAISALLRQPSATDATSPQVERVVISGATLHVSSTRPNSPAWQLARVQADVTPNHDGPQVKLVVQDCKLAEAESAGSEPASSRLELQLQPAPGRMSGSAQSLTQTLTLQLTRWPAELIQLAAYRGGHLLDLEGTIDGTAQLQFQSPGWPTLDSLCDLTGKLQVRDGLLEAPQWLRDPLPLDAAELRMTAQAADDLVRVNEFGVQLPFGQVELSADVPKPTPADRGTAAVWISRLAAQPLECRGHIDLAQLAASVPATLRLRKDVQLQRGELSWMLKTAPEVAGSRVQGRVTATDLAGAQGGRELTISDPLSLDVQLTAPSEAHPNWSADHFRVSSAFLSATGRGDQCEGEVRWQADGARLCRELGQFFELRETKVAGRIEGHVQWQTTDNRWQLAGHAQGTDLAIASAQRPSLHEADMRLQVRGAGIASGWQLAELQQWQATLAIGQDRLSLTLRQPVRAPNLQSSWPLTATLDGDLTRWRTRVAWASQAELPRLVGTVAAESQLDVLPRQVTVRLLDATVRDFQLTTASQTVREPVVRITGQLDYQRAAQRLQCESLTLASTALSAKARDVQWPFDPQTKRITQLHLRGDLSKLWQHAGLYSGLSQAGYPAGELVAQVQLQPIDGGLAFRLESEIEPFTWYAAQSSKAQSHRAQSHRAQSRAAPQSQRFPNQASRPSPQANNAWRDAQLRLAAEGTWSPASGRLVLDSSRLQSEALVLDLAGSLADWTGTLDTNLRGQTRVNWERLSQQIRPWTGNAIQLRGVSQQPFALRGPLRAAAPATLARDVRSPTRRVSQVPPGFPAWIPDALTADVGVGWQSAELFGFNTGPATFHARLADQTVRLTPLNLPLAAGSLRLSPELRLQAPWTVRLAPGPLAEEVAITPEMCQRWLKYVAPLIADTTAAEGRFSARLARADLPLQAPLLAEAGGSLTVHTARVGPGPATQELLALAQQVRALVDPQRGTSQWLDAQQTWILLPEQAVPFRVSDGRVAHQNLVMVMGDVTVRTRGWVGFDQQLSLVAEIPIQDDWVSRNRWLASLRGQAIEVPISGHVSHPRVDRRVLQTLAHQAARGAAENVLKNQLQDELKNQLNRLFE